MCMTLALSLGDYSIVACDRRHSLYTKGGDSRRGDYGGKLARIGSAWITFGGDGLHAGVVLEHLSGINARSVDDVISAIAAVATDAPANIARRWPGVPSAPNECSNYLVAVGSEIAAVRFDGTVVLRGSNLLVIAYPVGFPNREKAQARMESSLSEARDHWQAVRMIAREFETVANVSASVSSEIELVVNGEYIRGNSQELSFARNADLARLITDPPQPNPAAFYSILEEFVA